jgi:hypothetical protein
MGELLGRVDIAPAIIPVDLQTAQTGKRILAAHASWATFVIFKAAGTAGDDPTFDLQQADAASAGNIKDFDVISHYYLKAEATLDADEVWSKVTQSAASEIADPGGAGTSAEEQQIIVIEVDLATLDIANGFKWISLNCADTGTNAQLGAALVILTMAHPSSPATLPATQ